MDNFQPSKDYSIESRHVLSMEDLSPSEIETILELGLEFQRLSEDKVKKAPLLRGKTVINLFFENSTRTRISFELAGKRLSADVINISKSGSSSSKNETLYDTAKNISAMKPDVLVVRHSSSGAPLALSKLVNAAVINAGDGAHEHPSQALLDMLTIRQKLGSFQNKRVCIVGDIAHSRVARSNIIGLSKMGAKVSLVGPASMIPKEMEQYGVDIYYDLIPGIQDADVIMTLRIQKERIGLSPFPSLREYSRFYGVSPAVMKAAKQDVMIMHPGPVNRGVEIAPEVADGPYSVILSQVTNGVAVRMALLYLLGK